MGFIKGAVFKIVKRVAGMLQLRLNNKHDKNPNFLHYFDKNNNRVMIYNIELNALMSI